MKTKITALIFIGILGAVSVPAKSPVRCMSATSLGVEYISLWRGQTITESAVPSHELIQQVAFNYAPVEYIQFLIGLGMDRFRVTVYEKREFDGNFGFAFTAGGYANTPALKVKGKDILRITGGCDILLLNSKDNDNYKL